MTPAHLEQRLDPQISHPQRDERPEVTLDRTRELLARSRATLNAANKRLGHQGHEGQVLAPPGNEPLSETRQV